MKSIFKPMLPSRLVWGALALLVVAGESNADTTCRKYIEIASELVANAKNPDYDRKGAANRLTELAGQAFNEWPKEKGERLTSIYVKNHNTSFEDKQMSLNSYRYCREGGPDSLLKDALEKAVLQIQAAHQSAKNKR